MTAEAANLAALGILLGITGSGLWYAFTGDQRALRTWAGMTVTGTLFTMAQSRIVAPAASSPTAPLGGVSV